MTNQAGAARSSSPSRILLADDNADMREYIQRLLAGNYEVQSVGDGEAALAAALENPPDLVLTDIIMPRMDGFTLLQALRSDPRTSQVPVILLSAPAGEEARVEGLQAVGDDYLTKPFSASELLARVSSKLQSARAAADAVGVREERFRRYFELGLIGMAMTSPEKGCIDVNDEICRILGYERSELLQMTWAQLTHPDDLAADLANFERAMAGGIDGYCMEKRWIRKDGHVINSIISVKCLHQEDGSVDHFVAFLQDITARKLAEEALARSHGELERLVAERTAQLMVVNDELTDEIIRRTRSEVALRRSQRQLQALTTRLMEAQEAESKYVARELHDHFSQKLAVLGMEIAELAHRAGGSSSQLGGELLETTEQLGTLAKDIHRISRRLHPSILDDLGLAAALKSECAAFAAQHGVPIEFESDDIPQGVPDEISLCLYRVAQECLRNVDKHAAATEVRVVLSGGADEIAMEIADVGDGFDPENIKGKGGLGLISMEERVRLVDGAFLIRSQPGKGTTVRVRVPLR